MLRKIILNIVCIITIIIFIFCCLKSLRSLLFSTEYEVNVNSSNREEILSLISDSIDRFVDPEKVTKIIYSPRLGDGELYVYEGFKKYDTGLISQNSKIRGYILDNGKNANTKYKFFAVFSLILILFLKRSIDKYNKNI